MFASISNQKKRKTKLYLYSGHDFNIIMMLRALNLFHMHDPEYSSAVVVELLEENHIDFVKVAEK